MNYDIIFENAEIYDGTGKPSFHGDVAIKDGKIEKIGDLKDASFKKKIDAKGKILTPGFIDVHSHADLVIYKKNHPSILEPLLRQGITTFVGGNCGMGVAPLKNPHIDEAITYIDGVTCDEIENYRSWETISEFFDTIEKQGSIMNFGVLVPHGIVRIISKGMRNEKANTDEIEKMKQLVSEGLDAGALGMSTGLMYFPGMASEDKELIELAKLLKEKEAVFSCHLRSYSNTLPQAIDEVLELSRKTGVKIQISHFFHLPHIHKLIDTITFMLGRVLAQIYKKIKIPIPLDGVAKKQLKRIDKEIKNGLPIGIDAMPTGSGFTHILAFFPPWVLEGNMTTILNRFKDKETRKKILESIKNGKSKWPHREEGTWSMNFFNVLGFKSIYLMSVVNEENKKYEGKHFVKIGRERKQHPFDAVCDILLEEDGKVLAYISPTFPGDEFAERGSYAAIADPNSSIVTDMLHFGFGKTGHLVYDCFPRILSKYVKQEKLLTMSEAIRKSTSLPAKQLGIKERGEIKKGFWADIVLFDPETIKSNSTPDKADQYPDGIEYVLVNGFPVVSPDGYFHEKLNGKIIRRKST